VAKKAKELQALDVKRLKTPGLHAVGGVAGLALQIAPGGSTSWVLRVMVGDKRREMGLGGYPDVTLAGAREAARIARAKIKEGIDPIDSARSARSALAASRAKEVTFKQCGAAYIEAHEPSWKNAKHGAQWTATLTSYAYPIMGHLLARDVELSHILAALEPIWNTKTVTAVRLRGRIESILDWAIARGYRSGPNPARWKGHLEQMLPSPKKIKKEAHYPAIQVGQMGAFMEALRSHEGVGARALELLALTAVRSAGVREMTWDEVDLKKKIWTIPGERMKAGAEHRVPLSDAAIRIIKAQPVMSGSNLVFNTSRGGLLSDMTMSQLMRRMDFKDEKGRTCVPHGLRSTFRDWCSECTNYPTDVAEMALAHKVPDKVEAAYRRGNLFEKRRPMMEAWAAFCSTR